MVLRPSAGTVVRALATAGTASLVLYLGLPAQANPPQVHFTQVNQVSNQAGVANLQDPGLVNAWGLALSATSPLWVANNGTNTATIYPGGVGGAAVTKAGLTVSIAGGAPTGQVFNDTTSFVVTGTTGSGPATFMFDSEGGDITAWNRAATGTSAPVVAHVDGAVFKGMALWHTPFGPVLLAADFAGGHVLAFDGSFHQLALPGFMFTDPRLPRGYAPFNVLTVGDTVYVAYAKQQAGSTDEQAGAGLGFVDRYTKLGTEVRRIASRGTLNAPWGLAIAPASFGRFAGDLLVGNFGDGRISAFGPWGFEGQLRDRANHVIVIDGLWALLPGTATSGGVNALWFSAGPDDEANGLVGQLIPAG
ncbi:MAG TPA: TIGR03118 family protein [Rugosimonospora sp.]|nr:TIGR03118 family protein [Rugosimonospora sp.]